MKIEAGKYYKTRDGRTVKVMEDDGTDRWPLKVDHGQLGQIWHGRDGVSNIGETNFDIIAPACPEQGTLKEIGAKPGDVVEWVSSDGLYTNTPCEFGVHTIQEDGRVLLNGSDKYWGYLGRNCGANVQWRIISRASDKPASPIRTVARKEIVPGVC